MGLPPDWVDISEGIATTIQCIRVKMTELAKAHAKALTPSFGDGKEDQHVAEALSQKITGLLRKSEKRLQNLSTSTPSKDSNIRKNVQRAVATDLRTLSVELRKKQSSYLKHLQQQKEGHDSFDLEMNENKSRLEVDKFGETHIFLFMILLQKPEFWSLWIGYSNCPDTWRGVASANELAQIMKDLSVLVRPGTIVDRIVHNIQNAERTQREGGMVRCVTVLVVICFIVLVLLILKEILL
ncbi:hypothetical protein NMG60_11035064 [Bertholletia excelsa]